MRQEFSISKDITYLNHAAVAPWPKRTAEAVKAFAEENALLGAANYPQWLRVERELRGHLQRLLNAPSADDIALVKNTSEGLSIVAYGLDWQPGDNVIVANQEFPSNRIVWESLKKQGVEVRLADISVDDPEASMLALCDARTRLIAVSSVQYGTGLRMDLARLGGFCRSNDILFCVDAIQSLGALRFDAQACHADFVVADGHKWMLGPEGLAVFFATAEARERLRLLQYGWHMIEHAGDFDRTEWQVAKSAHRFEPGSPNMFGIHGLNASLSLLADVGMKSVESRLLSNTALLLACIESEPVLELLTRNEPGRYAGIVTFRRNDMDDSAHASLYRHLMANGVICALRGGGIRFSHHYYTPEKYLERAVSMATAFDKG